MIFRGEAVSLLSCRFFYLPNGLCIIYNNKMDQDINHNLNDRGQSANGALREQIKRALLVDIFSGNLAAGSHLVVQKLARQFEVSSTPIRETLVELMAAGMVEFTHNRGAVVRPFGPEALREICQIRRVLEVEATRTACGNIDLEQLESIRLEMVRLRDTVPRDELWSRETLVIDRKFHSLISDSAGSQRLNDELARYDLLAQSMATVVGNQSEIQTRGIFEHLILIDRLTENNREAAADEMGRHIGNTARDLEKIFFADQ
jgi:DNA-binding GntR family transcriptional regulator